MPSDVISATFVLRWVRLQNKKAEWKETGTTTLAPVCARQTAIEEPKAGFNW